MVPLNVLRDILSSIKVHLYFVPLAHFLQIINRLKINGQFQGEDGLISSGYLESAK
jgi:hypothetical protein